MKVSRPSLGLLKKISKKKFVILAALFPLMLSFQNCSKISNSEFDTISATSTAGLPGERKVNLTVETLTSSLAGKVKVLLIVDNSATMSFSQSNLSRNISALLEKLKNFDVDLKIVSTTFSSPGCNDAAVSGGTNCPSLPAFLSNKTDSFLQWNFPEFSLKSHLTSNATMNVANPTFSMRRAMASDQKTNIVNQISQAISNMSTQGSDKEEAFAALAAHLDSSYNFFKPGDKALVYIITDENDGFETAPSSLLKPKSTYVEVKTPFDYAISITAKVYTAYWDIYKYRENLIDTYLNSQGSSSDWITESQCLDSSSAVVAAPGDPPLQNFRCVFGQEKLLTVGSLSSLNTLFGTNFDDEAELCSHVVTTLKSSVYSAYANAENDLACSPNFIEGLSGPEEKKRIENYFLGLGPSSTPAEAILKVKSRIEYLFGSSFYLAVSTNLSAQPCTLQTGQSYDTFYSSYLPASPLSSILNADSFAINSICSNDEDLRAFLSKLSVSFEKKVNEQFNIELFKDEEPISLKYSSGGTITDLIPNVDYFVSSGFIQIKNNRMLKSLDRIEVRIKTPPVAPTPRTGPGGTFHGS